MDIAFKIIMLLIICITFIGAVGERENPKLRNNLSAICIASIFGYVIGALYLG